MVCHVVFGAVRPASVQVDGLTFGNSTFEGSWPKCLGLMATTATLRVGKPPKFAGLPLGGRGRDPREGAICKAQPQSQP